MNEIVKMVASKTGLSESMAKTAVDVVVSQLKDRLPEGIAGQVDNFLGDGGSDSKSDLLGGLTDSLGGMFGK